MVNGDVAIENQLRQSCRFVTALRTIVKPVGEIYEEFDFELYFAERTHQ